eukprot:4395109-Pyramimonas_sp.AAC.1
MSRSAEMVELATGVIARLAAVLEALGPPAARDRAKILSSLQWLAEQVARRLRVFGFEAMRQLT